MIEELCDQIWSHNAFHIEKQELILSSLKYTLSNNQYSEDSSEYISNIVPRILECASIFAKSKNELYRKASYELAVSVWNLFGNRNLELEFDNEFVNNCLSTVFSRLGNFPANNYLLGKIGKKELESIPLQLQFEHDNHVIENQINLVDYENLILTDFQRDLWYALSEKEVVVVSAPTSAGKSFALQHFLIASFLRGEANISAYIVPTRALISQVSKDVSTVLSKYNKEIVVTEVPIPVERDQGVGLIYVLTQERLQILLTQYDVDIDLIIIDEAQGISASSRGVVLQSVVEKALEERQPSKLIFGAPFVKNPNVFLETFGLDDKDTTILQTNDSPVSQNLLHLKTSDIFTSTVSISLIQEGDSEYNVSEVDIGTELIQDNVTLANIAYHFGKGSQNILFGSEPARCEKLCQLLLGLKVLDEGAEEIDRDSLKEFSALIRTHIHKDFTLAEFIDKGIAFHYGNLPSFIRRGIQELISNGNISFVVCTSTLLQGINLPAKNIFILKPSKGGGWGQGSVPISSTEFWNLVGRAGRLTKDFEGNIFLINLDKWDKNPTKGERMIDVKPSFRNHVCHDTEKLLEFIYDLDHPSGRLTGIENSFMKLYNDFTLGRLETTLERYEKYLSKIDKAELIDSIKGISSYISVPYVISESNPNISIYRQQEMLDYLYRKLDEEGPEVLIPPHPLKSDRNTYQLYLRMFKRIHNNFEKLPTSDKSNLYFASLALKWMRGQSYSELLKKRIEYSRKRRIRGEPNVNTEARGLFSEIENDLRFRYVKYTKCYIDLLSHALSTTGREEYCSKIPPIYLFLEIGASSMTMMSLIGLGISRTGSAIISGNAPRTDMNRDATLKWLRKTNLESMGLPTILEREVKLVI